MARSFRSSYILLGVIIGFGTIKFIEKSGDYSIAYLLFIFLSLAVFYPIIYRIYHRSFDIAEIAIWFTLYYFLHFGVRFIYDRLVGSPILALLLQENAINLINSALGVSIIGLLFFWLGYSIRFGKTVARSTSSLYKEWNKNLILPVVLFCTLIGWGLRLFSIISQTGGIREWIATNKYILLAETRGFYYINIIGGLALTAVFLLFIAGRKYKKRLYWFLFIILSIPYIIFALFRGTRASIPFFFLGLLICYYMTSGRGYELSMRLGGVVIILVLLTIVAFPFLSIVRGGGVITRETFSKSLEVLKNPMLILQSGVFSRAHGLDTLTLLIEKVPKKDPFIVGTASKLLLVSWIPRKLWPEKPIISLGKIFGEKYCSDIFQKGTSVAVTMPGGFYWALGIAGVIIGMFFIGILWRFLYEYFIRPRGNLSNALIVSLMFPVFFYSAVEQTIGSLLSMHLFTFLVNMFIILVIGKPTVKIKKYEGGHN